MNRRYIAVTSLVVVLLSSLVVGIARSQGGSASQAGLTVVRSDASGIVLELSTPAYERKQVQIAAGTFDQLTVPSGTLTSDPGRPQVPVVSAVIGVPPDVDVKLHVVADKADLLAGSFELSPAPNAAPLDDDFRPGEKRYEKDAAVYARDALYPDVPARIADEAWLRGQRIVRVELYPFQYNPARGTLLWHENLTVELTFDGAVAGTADFEEDTAFEPALREMLLNYESARAWRTERAPASVDTLAGTAASDTTPRYKIVVDEDGLYRVSYADLQAAGLPADVDPRTFRLINQGREVAIHVEGEGDGSFDGGDYIEFYGQRFRGDVLAETDAAADLFWLVDRCEELPAPVYCPFNPANFDKDYAAQLEKYTDENVYWLEYGGTPGPRIDTVDGTPSGATTPAYYTDTVRAEQDEHWYSYHFSTPDTWFWDRVQSGHRTVTRTYSTTLTALAPSASVSATVRAHVVARTTKAHETSFYLNDHSEPVEDALWPGKTGFSFETQVPHRILNDGTNDLQMVVASTTDEIYFNWFEIKYARRFVAEDDQLWFSQHEAGQWQYQANGFDSATTTILEVTDPLDPVHIDVHQSSIYVPIVTSMSATNITAQPSTSADATINDGFSVTFDATTTSPSRYYVVGAGAIKKPKKVTEYWSSNLTSTANGADHIIITHRNFKTAAQELAAYRTSQGLRSMVVDVEDVYNEFGYGIFTPIAIKSFLAYAYQNWEAPAPSYVVLIGDGHWNFKGDGVDTYGEPDPIYMPPNLVVTDPWQGEVDSANLLATVDGDDPLPDLYIGRIPVTGNAQLQTVVEKIKSYEQSAEGAPADWHTRALFVADNADSAGDFAELSNTIIDNHLPEDFAADRIYLDEYMAADACEGGADGRKCVAANRAITETLNQTGTLLMNYIGHASVNRWAGEQIFINADIPTLTNGDTLPVLLSMNCLDGYWIHPELESLSSRMLTEEGKGTVASFSPTGLGVATGHDALHRGFYDTLFGSDESKLGLATTDAKSELYGTGANYDLLNTFTIFGDPALQIPTP